MPSKHTKIGGTYNAPPGEIPHDAPTDSAKIEFSRRLQLAMRNKGWTQSDLSKRAADHMPEGESIGRDSVSLYVRGMSFPSNVRLAALAKALGVAPADLIPTRGVRSSTDNAPPVDVRQTEDGKAWLRISQAVEWDEAVKILEILKAQK